MRGGEDVFLQLHPSAIQRCGPAERASTRGRSRQPGPRVGCPRHAARSARGRADEPRASGLMKACTVTRPTSWRRGRGQRKGQRGQRGVYRPLPRTDPIRHCVAREEGAAMARSIRSTDRRWGFWPPWPPRLTQAVLEGRPPRRQGAVQRPGSRTRSGQTPPNHSSSAPASGTVDARTTSSSFTGRRRQRADRDRPRHHPKTAEDCCLPPPPSRVRPR